MENSSAEDQNVPKEKNRRQFLKVAAIGLGAGFAGILGNRARTHPDRAETHEKTDSEQLPPQLTREWSENIDSPTTEQLMKVYGAKIDAKSFPNEEYKRDFMQKIIQISASLNPENTNLANQIAALISYSTNESFDPRFQNPKTKEGGLFGLSSENCDDLGVKFDQVQHLSPSEQLVLFEKLLKMKLTPDLKESGTMYWGVSDLIAAQSHKSVLGAPKSTIFYKEGDKSYRNGRDFDLDRNGEVTGEEIEQTIINHAVDKGEKLRWIEDLKEKASKPVEMPELIDDTSAETEADGETASWLRKIYKDCMTDPFYVDDEFSSADDKKLMFMEELTRIATRLNKDNPFLANQIAAVINFESGSTFSSSKVNEAGSGAVGLIQFTQDTAEGMGISSDILKRMNPIQQLHYVELFLSSQKDQLLTLGDVYMAVLWPVAVGEDDSYELFQTSEEKSQNAGLDSAQDGRVTKKEAYDKVLQRALSQGEQREYLGVSN